MYVYIYIYIYMCICTHIPIRFYPIFFSIPFSFILYSIHLLIPRTILWCWVLVLKRQRPTFLSSSSRLLLPPPPSSQVRGPIGSSTEGSSGRVRMRYPPRSGAPLTRFVPHKELHPRPQWQGPHAVLASLWRTPHTFGAP